MNIGFDVGISGFLIEIFHRDEDMFRPLGSTFFS
jgi:hypothetical protein